MNKSGAIFALIACACCCAQGCRTTPKITAGLRPVPVTDGLIWLSAEQQQLIDEKGSPDALWVKPLGVLMWVYCEKDRPPAVLEFDAYGQQMGATFKGNRLLCTAPASSAAKSMAREGDSLSFDEIMDQLRSTYRLRHEAGRAQAGMSLAEAALSMQPRDPEALRLAGDISVHLASNLRPGESRAFVARKGLAWTQSLLAMGPESVEAHMRAVILRGLSLTTARLKPAVLERELQALDADLAQAIKLDPDFKQGLPRIVRLHLLLFSRPAGWKDELDTQIKMLKTRYPDSPCLKLLQADLAIVSGDKKTARGILQRLIQQLPAGTNDFAESATMARWATERLNALDGDLSGAPALMPERYPLRHP